jgi:hypothetical protein
VFVTAAAVVAVGADTVAAKGCTPGVRRTGKVVFNAYCGPATAVVHFRGRTVRFRSGRCQRRPGRLYVNIGTLTSGGTPRYRYFTAYVEARRDGTYHRGVISWQYPGAASSLDRMTIRLAEHRSRGTFSGERSGIRTGRARGSFRCS